MTTFSVSLLALSIVAAEPPVLPPAAIAQNRMLPPQAVSVVHVSADGNVWVGTLAFRHDANLWQLSKGGEIVRKTFVPPWAPFQLATTADGKTLAVGLAHSRVTSPEPTVWIGPAEAIWNSPLGNEHFAADSRDGERARWRSGQGDWRTGWFASHFGELFAGGKQGVFQFPNTWVNERRETIREPLASRPTRMAVSGDGEHVAFAGSESVSVWRLNRDGLNGDPMWSVPINSIGPARQLVPHDFPSREFPALAKRFRLDADEWKSVVLPTALAVNRTGSLVAVVQQSARQWLRTGPAIGEWDPPIHRLQFVPDQRARLRIWSQGEEQPGFELPSAGAWELGFDAQDAVWCWPASWPARGMAGAAWLPSSTAQKVFRRSRPARRENTDSRTVEFELPAPISHAAVNPVRSELLVSCWNGQVIRVADDLLSPVEMGAPGRVAWSPDGQFAIIGTEQGDVFRLDSGGRLAWSKKLPASEPSAEPTLPAEVVAGLPVYQGGRLPASEHAYVGDIWMIRDRTAAVMVDCGGVSGFATTRARLRALGVDRVTHILHTHSHGDHCGGAYLWRAAGARIVAPRSAELTLIWLMPMLTDYGVFPPRPVDDPLPLNDVGDETEFVAGSHSFRVLFVPGHTFDSAVYLTELSGRRVAFTGDLGFEKQDIVHRCWGDRDKARAVVKVIRDKLLAWKPEIVFTGHGVRTNGTEFVADLVRRTEETLAADR